MDTAAEEEFCRRVQGKARNKILVENGQGKDKATKKILLVDQIT